MLIRLAATARGLAALAVMTILLVSGCSRNANKLASGENPAADTTSSLTAEIAAQLAELDALQCPANARPENFVKVKAHMREILLQKADSKQAKRAPDTGSYDPYNTSWNDQMNLIWEDDGTMRGRLTWEYKNRGDYNQDGIVGIADCTPLAVHYECEIGQPCLAYPNEDMEEVHLMLDGDESGTIDTSDEQAIYDHHDCSVAYYSVRGAASSPFDTEKAKVERTCC
jgi:hypothetical protein